MPRLTNCSMRPSLIRKLFDMTESSAVVVSQPAENEVQQLIEKTKTTKLSKNELALLLDAMALAKESNQTSKYVEIRQACVRDWYGPDAYTEVIRIAQEERRQQDALIEQSRTTELFCDEFKTLLNAMLDEYWNTDDAARTAEIRDALVSTHRFRVERKFKFTDFDNVAFRGLCNSLPDKNARDFYPVSCAIKHAILEVHGCGGPDKQEKETSDRKGVTMKRRKSDKVTETGATELGASSNGILS